MSSLAAERLFELIFEEVGRSLQSNVSIYIETTSDKSLLPSQSLLVDVHLIDCEHGSNSVPGLSGLREKSIGHAGSGEAPDVV